jgi:hypothetical protein
VHVSRQEAEAAVHLAVLRRSMDERRGVQPPSRGEEELVPTVGRGDHASTMYRNLPNWLSV